MRGLGLGFGVVCKTLEVARLSDRYVCSNRGHVALPGEKSSPIVHRHETIYETDPHISLRSLLIGTYKTVDCIALSKTGYDVPQGVYNARPGYSAEKLPVVLEDQVNELIKSVLEHIRAVIFSTQEEAQYFLAWLAKQLQFPTNKSGVALILIGDQGVGKNIIINWYINYLLGTDVRLQVGNASRIFGGHGGHSTALINKVLCVVDKADHAALEPHMHTLKDMITGETLDIYPRSKSAFQMSNMVNLMFTTNEKNPFALEASDSHFVVFECNDSKKGDFAYFENLGKNLNNRTARAFFQFLLGFDLSDYGCFRAKRPDTQTYRRHLKVPMLYSFLSYACIQCAR